jgi:phosphoglycolate phosphatase-like HAD superfamily hydrolase
LDFDGTLTDVEKEGAPFVEGYMQDLAILLRKSLPEVHAMAEAAYHEIATESATNGWSFAGELMCPSTVDPYVRMKAVARKLLGGAPPVFSDERIEGLLEVLFRHLYKTTTDSFKPGFRDLFDTVSSRNLPVYIVTNSQTKPVQDKIERGLGSIRYANAQWWKKRVIGNARKFDPCESSESPWPSTFSHRLQFPGFPRGTVIKRPSYLRTLVDLVKKPLPGGIGFELEWEKVVVVGDNFELDLALPLFLGCHLGFMVNEHSPTWEVEFVRNHPMGRILRSVNEILPYYLEV